MRVPAHLGGHYGNGHVDLGILNAFREEVCERPSILDIGCGLGFMLDRFLDHGLDAFGIDGDPTIQRANFRTHDFTRAIDLRRTFDLVWSTEFLEHLDARHLPNFFAAFSGCRWAIVTAAPPGRGGHHHVNCQPEAYWLSKFKEQGWRHDADQRRKLRAASWPMLCKPRGVIVRSAAFDSLMFFRKD